MNIWYITDHKAGHVAQARGLFAALERTGISVTITEVSVADISKFSLFLNWISAARFGVLPQNLLNQVAPDLIIGIGHSTHWALILFKKCFPSAKSIVLMKPSLPLTWFDYAIIPAHDFADPQAIPPNVFISQGALNPLVNEHRHQKNRHLILIGGASKRYAFSEDMLIQQIQSLLAKISNQTDPQDVILTTSRRTPESFLSHDFFESNTHHVQIFPVTATPVGWLFEQLQLADTVWVTQDSVSMLFEALTAGCHVGVLEMPKTRSDRITNSIDEYVKEGLFLSLKAYLDGGEFQKQLQLLEADKVVVQLLEVL